MFEFGQLKDKSIADKIIQKLETRMIKASYQIDSQEVIHLYIETEEDIEIATDIFRVSMGFTPVFLPDQEWESFSKTKLKFITLSLMTISVLVFIWAKYLGFESVLNFLSFSNNIRYPFESVFDGQVWRLLTPAFIHFNFIHLLFNMSWLFQLGKVLEQELGTKSYILFLIVLAIFSNVGQAFVSQGYFGGMSGVVYGLFGFIWVISQIDKEWKHRLPKRDIALMVGWLILCLTGLLGNVANTAHAVGISTGMCFALIKSLKVSKSFSQSFKYFLISLGILIISVGWDIYNMK